MGAREAGRSSRAAAGLLEGSCQPHAVYVDLLQPFDSSKNHCMKEHCNLSCVLLDTVFGGHQLGNLHLKLTCDFI